MLLPAPARVRNELDQVQSYKKFDSQLHVDLKPKSEEANQEPTRRQAAARFKGVGIVPVYCHIKGDDLVWCGGLTKLKNEDCEILYCERVQSRDFAFCPEHDGLDQGNCNSTKTPGTRWICPVHGSVTWGNALMRNVYMY